MFSRTNFTTAFTRPWSFTGAPSPGARFTVDYCGGAAVGYKAFDRDGIAPLYPFGHGLSYTRFAFAAPRIAHDARGIRATTVIRNTGARAGAAVAQLYVERVGGGWEAPRRLAGWARRTLAAGARQAATIAIDPRLLANPVGCQNYREVLRGL